MTVQPPRIAGLFPKPSDSEVARGLEQVRQISSELFEGHVTYCEEEDCEIAGDRYFEFRVDADGDIDEILSLDAEWHRRVSMLPANLLGLFRLTFDACE